MSNGSTAVAATVDFIAYRCRGRTSSRGEQEAIKMASDLLAFLYSLLNLVVYRMVFR
jgi:hypothetical protein